MKLLDALTLVLLIALAFADRPALADNARIGEKMIVSNDAGVCNNLYYTSHYVDLYIHNGKDAADAFLAPFRASGDCITFKAGARVTVDGISTPPYFVCVHQYVGRYCYWTPNNLLSPDASE